MNIELSQITDEELLAELKKRGLGLVIRVPPTISDGMEDEIVLWPIGGEHG